MMISSQRYADEIKDLSFAKLIKERNRLLEFIQRFECGDVSEDEEIIDPQPVVVYQCYNEYLIEVSKRLNASVHRRNRDNSRNTSSPAADDNHYVLSPDIVRNQVSAWSTRYIPYAPCDWRREMRDELRKTIGHMRPGNKGLYASYISNSSQFCDVENVLFYNIGASAFKGLMQNGLCFERGFGSVPQPPYELLNAKHYYHYEIGNELRIWNADGVLASWENIELPAPASTSKPHLFWHALKRGAVIRGRESQVPSKFGLSIELLIPENAWCNLAVLIKPMLDGIISVFHYQNTPSDPVMLERLSTLIDTSTQQAETMLTDESLAVLGARSVVSVYRQGIIWNPQDDNCVACKVHIIQQKNASCWQISGCLFAVERNTWNPS